MCESTAYFKTNDGLEKIMENVVFIQPEKNGVFIEDILGEQKLVEGYLSEIKLLDHKIIIAK